MHWSFENAGQNLVTYLLTHDLCPGNNESRLLLKEVVPAQDKKGQRPSVISNPEKQSESRRLIDIISEVV